MQPKVGHYGVFNGSRFRAEIAPRIADFIANCEQAARKGMPARGGKGGSVVRLAGGKLASAPQG